jgi:hypothetical protein
MIIENNGFTNLMTGETEELTNRSQLFPGYPIATTEGSIITPDDLKMGGMAGLNGTSTQLIVGIGIVLLILWFMAKESK